MKKTVQFKNNIVNNIDEHLNKAVNFILLNYRGLSVKEMQIIRNNLKKNDQAELKVYKNTLLKIALNNHKITDFDQDLKGPNAIVFDYKEGIDSFKLLNKYCKEYKSLNFCSAFFENKYLNKEKLQVLASIPDKPTLLSTLAATFKAPIQKLACTLKEIKPGQ